ncbi:MAG TPA: hypothetical protein PK431_11720 [Chitinophagales bacterium]|nr:hypothetical protein [Chitinophagales bacterium]
MQKFSLLTIVCCFTLMFTACQKETLLETNSKNPTSINSTKNTNQTKSDLQGLFDDEGLTATYELDVADSSAIATVFFKTSKNSNGAAVACYNNTPNPNQCGTSFTYSSCQFGLEMWNDPTNLYLDFDFSSQFVGTRRDCYGKTCNYWIVPYFQLRLYNANGAEIGVVNLSSSSITTTGKSFTVNIASLANYGNVACVSLSGYFKALKKCTGGCGGSYGSTQCVGTYCIANNACQRFCLQVCPSVCPTVSEINVDRLKVCGSGSIKGTVTVVGDASKTATVWTVDGQTYSGNTVSIALPLNSTCSTITKNITAKVICTTDQSVLAERSFSVDVNPALTASINVDNSSCNATIDISCPSDIVDITWTYGAESGIGNTIQVGSSPETIYYTISKSGCSYTGSQDNVICLPFLQSITPKSNQ